MFGFFVKPFVCACIFVLRRDSPFQPTCFQNNLLLALSSPHNFYKNSQKNFYSLLVALTPSEISPVVVLPSFNSREVMVGILQYLHILTTWTFLQNITCERDPILNQGEKMGFCLSPCQDLHQLVPLHFEGSGGGRWWLMRSWLRWQCWWISKYCIGGQGGGSGS